MSTRNFIKKALKTLQHEGVQRRTEGSFLSWYYEVWLILKPNSNYKLDFYWLFYSLFVRPVKQRFQALDILHSHVHQATTIRMVSAINDLMTNQFHEETVLLTWLSFLFSAEIKTLNTLLEQQKVLYGILKSNFSQTAEYLKTDLDNAVKDKNEHHSQVIQLRQENMNLKSQLDVYTKKCKEDFAESLQGIQTVTSAFLAKIDNFFTNSVTFHLTCPKQEEQMERIRSNCSSLSRQVEDKFQSYLDSVGAKVSSIQKQSSRLDVQNAGLTSELDKCKTDREKETAESSKKQQDAQQTYDKQLEQLLKDQSRLRDAKDLLEAQLSVNDATLISLRNGCAQQVRVLLGWMMMLKTSGKYSMVANF